MKLMKRNLVPVYYCLYKGKQSILDDEGYETSEFKVTYEKPVRIMINLSPAMGYAQAEMFGNLDAYDKIMVTEDTNCPIDENTVLFVDSEPTFRNGTPDYDYTVKCVAKSLNFISYAISKVKVS